LDKTSIHQLNSYYAMFRTNSTVDNLSRNSDRTMNSCEDPLRDKVRESLIGMNTLEMESPIVLKRMLDIIMDIDDSDLWDLTENLPNIQMKDIHGEISALSPAI